MLASVVSPRTRVLDAHQPQRGVPLPARTPGALQLDLNELSGRPPAPAVVAAVEEWARRGAGALAAYPRGGKLHDQAVRAVARYRGVREADEAGLLLTAGSDEALRIVSAAHAHAAARTGGAFFLAPVPTYGSFLAHINALDGARLVCPTARSAEELHDAVRWATTARSGPPFSVMYVVSPAAPLGYVVPDDWVMSFAERNPSTMVVVDEAYGELVGRGRWGGSGLAAAAAAGRVPNLLVTGTFSKAFGLAGLRIGYLASHPDNVRILRGMYQPHAVTDLAKAAATACLTAPGARDHYEAGFADIGASREAVRNMLAGGGGWGHVGEAGMSAVLFSPDPDAAAQALRADCGIACSVVRGDGRSPPGPAVRVTLPVDKETLHALLRACTVLRLRGAFTAPSAPLGMPGI